MLSTSIRCADCRDEAARSAACRAGINMPAKKMTRARRTNVPAIGLAGPAVKASAVDMTASIGEDEKRGCNVVCWCLMAKRPCRSTCLDGATSADESITKLLSAGAAASTFQITLHTPPHRSNEGSGDTSLFERDSSTSTAPPDADRFCRFRNLRFEFTSSNVPSSQRVRRPRSCTPAAAPARPHSRLLPQRARAH